MSFSRLLRVQNPGLCLLFNYSQPLTSSSSSSLPLTRDRAALTFTTKVSYSSDMVKAIRVHELGGPQVSKSIHFSSLSHTHLCFTHYLQLLIRFWSGRMWKLEIQKKARSVWGTKPLGLISLMSTFAKEFTKPLLFPSLQVPHLHFSL